MRTGMANGWGILLTLGVAGLCGASGLAATPGPLPKPTLAYLGAGPGGDGAHGLGGPGFRQALAQDLRESGVFKRVELPAGSGALEASPPADLGEGDLLLRTQTRVTGHGKLLVTCKGTRSGNPAADFSRVFVADRQAWPWLAHRVADFIVAKVTGTPGVAASELVFARRTGPGTSEIFGSERDGSHLRKLTAFGSMATHPTLAADGRLALVSFKGGPPEIWGQGSAFGPLQKLYPDRGHEGLGISDLAWSPDGTRIAFIQENHTGTAGLRVLEPQSGRVICLTLPAHRAQSPSWNPEGTALAYVSDQDGGPQVFIVDADGGHLRQLTRGGAPKLCAAWAPVGDRIAFAAAATGRSEVWTVKPDGEQLHPVATLTESVQSLCWAPDGRWLLFGLKHAGEFRLAVSDLEGFRPKLADDLAAGQFPQWTRAHPKVAVPPLADSSAAHREPAPHGAASPS